MDPGDKLEKFKLTCGNLVYGGGIRLEQRRSIVHELAALTVPRHDDLGRRALRIRLAIIGTKERKKKGQLLS